MTIHPDAICRVCSGGPGNYGACLCGLHAYDLHPADPAVDFAPYPYDHDTGTVPDARQISLWGEP